MNWDFKIAIYNKFGTQARFSDKCKIDEATISKFVRGIQVPTKSQKHAMEKVLEMPIDGLLRQGFYLTD